MTDWQWYSICSQHQVGNPECPRCNIGKWVDEADPEVMADHALWESDPDAWRAKHRRDSLDFVDKTSGQEVFPFPNLTRGDT